ncbi:amino acid/amide ABC transporter membrane protein 1, HAAT family [Archaeoglobus sulfaticallidus PM70-1]|uniref:Amino acid/amide ABC transporter membrane protein 1, HAAT family n=1 Tax=Archaeoglobus sulfaticallidus PM70-1 TaxID=387631 RepID=N0BMG8_9EURY|nr:branched-chain amino acid ABC transporter permease [Archaeoglobus sulfaticallidus]AGK61826.1 amino acid/amide ABC transporter membrane protein 1, HAAT family [Archaeoglobus sulfaticallidus PM70-1]
MVFLEQLAGNLIYGAILGSVYGLSTMGLSLIFGVLRIVNVGHGPFIMVGAFTAFWMFTLFGLAPIGSIPVAIVLGLALGFVIFYTVIRRLLNAPELSTLLATFAIGILLEEVAKFIWGPDHRGYSWNIGDVDIGIILIPYSKILAFISSIIIAYLLYLWFQKTKLGKAVRAVVEDAEGAATCGINVRWIYALSFAIGIALTVASGVLVTLFVPVGINPYMGHEYTLKAFVIAVLGGLGSPWGAFFAGFLFGLIENGSYTILGLIPGVEPFSLTRFVAFTLLLVILLIKPTGLFGGDSK